MTNTIQELYDRKSCRVFTDKPISDEDKTLILNAALQAPTAGNMSLYSILDIQNEDIKKKLAENCDHQDFIAKAPMVLVFLADYQKWADLFKAYDIDETTDGPADLYLAMEDAIIAAQNAVVAAQSLGINSCYIGDIIEQFESNREMLHLPRYVVPVCMAVFGYPVQSQIDRKKPPRFAIEDMVFTDIYPDRNQKDLEDMFMRKYGYDRKDVKDDITRLAKRKFTADFHQEMNRSMKEMYRSWSGISEIKEETPDSDAPDSDADDAGEIGRSSETSKIG